MINYKDLGLVNTRDMFARAIDGGYAIPAFNYLNGRAMFIVAGAPACMEELKAAGIENFIHVRVNVLDELRKYSAQLLK